MHNSDVPYPEDLPSNLFKWLSVGYISSFGWGPCWTPADYTLNTLITVTLVGLSLRSPVTCYITVSRLLGSISDYVVYFWNVASLQNKYMNTRRNCDVFLTILLFPTKILNNVLFNICTCIYKSWPFSKTSKENFWSHFLLTKRVHCSKWHLQNIQPASTLSICKYLLSIPITDNYFIFSNDRGNPFNINWKDGSRKVDGKVGASRPPTRWGAPSAARADVMEQTWIVVSSSLLKYSEREPIRLRTVERHSAHLVYVYIRIKITTLLAEHVVKSP